MHKIIKLIKEYAVMITGSLIYSLGIGLFLDPNNLAPGGVTGVGIILSSFIPLETGTIIFLINIPIIIMGYIKLGRKLIWRTFVSVALTSIMIDSIHLFYGKALISDLLMAGLVGGGMVGLGIGLLMKCEATTGGTDIIVRILRRQYPHLSTGIIYSGMDCLVVLAVAIVFKDINLAFYALLTVVFSAYILDKTLYGRDEAKLIYIISDKSRELADRILKELEVGVTFVHGEGAYSGKDKEVIMVVVKKFFTPKVEEIIKETDRFAFIIISNANEIYGEGYKNILSEKL